MLPSKERGGESYSDRETSVRMFENALKREEKGEGGVGTARFNTPRKFSGKPEPYHPGGEIP